MPNHDLHGNVPDSNPNAIILIDVINDLEFKEGQQFLSTAIAVAQNIKQLLDQAHLKNIPVIYVNDNFGKWRSDFKNQINHCLHDRVIGQPIAQLLLPTPDDYYVLKTKNSAFYNTPLDLLLRYLKTKTVILAGFTTDTCIKFSALDAYLRDYQIIIHQDGVASFDQSAHQQALEYFQTHLKSQILSTKQIIDQFSNVDQQPLSTPANHADANK